MAGGYGKKVASLLETVVALAPDSGDADLAVRAAVFSECEEEEEEEKEKRPGSSNMSLSSSSSSDRAAAEFLAERAALLKLCCQRSRSL